MKEETLNTFGNGNGVPSLSKITYPLSYSYKDIYRRLFTYPLHNYIFLPLNGHIPRIFQGYTVISFPGLLYNSLHPSASPFAITFGAQPSVFMFCRALLHLPSLSRPSSELCLQQPLR